MDPLTVPLTVRLQVAMEPRVGGDDRECRSLITPVSLRADGDKAPTLEGYGAVFNQWAQIGGDTWGFMERIAPGAFTASIKENDVRSFFNHDGNIILGRTGAKTLTLREDDTGLHTVIQPPDTAAARDVVTLVTRGDVSGMSFMFRVRKEEWEEPAQKGQFAKRTLLDLDLIEVGPVALPAYPQTSIAARDQVTAFLEALERGMVPANISTDRAPRDTAWAALTLQDFTAEAWADLSADERGRIAKHFAWAKAVPPAVFSDLKFGHHRASDGKVVFRGVTSALGRLDQADLPEGDRAKVRAHLEAHQAAFTEDKAREDEDSTLRYRWAAATSRGPRGPQSGGMHR